MESFCVACSVENVAHRDRQASVAKALVDTGSEYTWLPQDVLAGIGIRREKKDVRFVMANGTTVTRGVGFAIIRIGKHFTVDEVVFAEARRPSAPGRANARRPFPGRGPAPQETRGGGADSRGLKGRARPSDSSSDAATSVS